MARLVVIVDDDVDPSNLAEVLWAVTTRYELSEQIDIIRDAWEFSARPAYTGRKKAAGLTSHSKAIIDACRPLAWKDKFPPASPLTHDEARKIEAKWGIRLAPFPRTTF